MQEIQETKRRVWPALSDEVYNDLLKYAEEEKRKPSEMAAIFIENAIKERNRKRKNAKEI